MENNKGFILLSRSLIESEIFSKPPLYLKVWIYLLTRAQHTDYKGLKRGQLYISIPEIQEACSHFEGFRKETPSYRNIRTIIDWLRNPCGGKHGGQHGRQSDGTMIGTTRVTHGMLVTICNYDIYQDFNYYGRQHERQYGNHTEGNTEVLRKTKQRQNINKHDKYITNIENNNSCSSNGNQENFDQLINFYVENFGMINAFIAQDITEWENHFAQNIILEAMKVALKNNKRTWSYVTGILKNWQKNNVKTLQDVQALETEFTNKQAKRTSFSKNISKNKKEVVPKWMNQEKQEQQEITPDIEERRKNIEEWIKNGT